MSVPIRSNEHVFIAGMTGSGKTFLAQTYLANYNNVQKYILDTKQMFEFEQVGDKKDIITNFAELDSATTKTVIYRPVWEELNEQIYNQFFEYCMKKRNCIIVVDEVMQICPNASRIPAWYKGALTRGRELGVGVWSLTQRPLTIPISIISESKHLFIFSLNVEGDRKRIVDATGYEEFYKKSEMYHFWYFDATKPLKPAYATLRKKEVIT